MPKFQGRMPASRRVLIVFLITIVSPGLVLVYFGAKSLLDERERAERQIQANLIATAETLGRRLESELSDWQQSADDMANTAALDPSLWPKRVRDAVGERGAAVVPIGPREGARALPASQLLYELSSAARDNANGVAPTRSASIESTEQLEFRD
jgi:hypothetical protein